MKQLLLIPVLVALTCPARPCEAAGWRKTVAAAQRRAAVALETALNAVDATPKQRTAIRRILARTATEGWTLRGEAFALQDAFAAAVLSPEPDSGELDDLEARGVALIARGVHLARSGVAESAAVLTPEQRLELLALWRRWLRRAAGT